MIDSVIVDISLQEALVIPKRVEINGDTVITARGMGISFGDESIGKGSYPSLHSLNHNAALSDGTGGALWLPNP
jgi:hypothetical protein